MRLVAMGVLMVLCIECYGRSVIGQAFIDLPNSKVPLLDSVMRADLVDYAEAGSVRPKVRNVATGMSQLDTLTGSYLKVTLSGVSNLEMALLEPGKKGEARYVVVYTIGNEGTAGDSQLMFFTESMEEISTERCIKIPELREFFHIPRGANIKLSDVEGYVPFPTVIYSLMDDGRGMTAKLTVGKYMSREDYAIVERWLVPELKYQWGGKSYKLVK